jgi:hypothetical protein
LTRPALRRSRRPNHPRGSTTRGEDDSLFIHRRLQGLSRCRGFGMASPKRSLRPWLGSGAKNAPDPASFDPIPAQA